MTYDAWRYCKILKEERGCLLTIRLLTPLQNHLHIVWCITYITYQQVLCLFECWNFPRCFFNWHQLNRLGTVIGEEECSTHSTIVMSINYVLDTKYSALRGKKTMSCDPRKTVTRSHSIGAIICDTHASWNTEDVILVDYTRRSRRIWCSIFWTVTNLEAAQNNRQKYTRYIYPSL